MKSVTRDEMKREIDQLPDDVLDRLYRYIQALKLQKLEKRTLPAHDLKGRFDNVDIRERAYK